METVRRLISESGRGLRERSPQATSFITYDPPARGRSGIPWRDTISAQAAELAML